MKVTISFDETKIVVPCGDGDITVRQLTNLAVTRYKKAIGKPNNFWVSVSNLKSCYEGGMLDPDDLVNIFLQLPQATDMGSISKTDLRPMAIIHALRRTFRLLKASQKLGLGCEQIGVKRESVYEIDS